MMSTPKTIYSEGGYYLEELKNIILEKFDFHKIDVWSDEKSKYALYI